MSAMPERAHPSRNGPPPAAAQDPPPMSPAQPRQEFRFTAQGEEWIAYLSGRGSYGTGHRGLASLQTVHFARAARPETPELEALTPALNLADLFESELVSLWQNARKIVLPDEGRPAAPRRGLEDSP